uniref:MADF domain-containing protein n=1 Tax=Anopheles arabiensis TaxID=7173 RepID=A0A182HPJ0_ANOAR
MGMLTDRNMYEEEYDEAAEMLVVYDPEPEIDYTSSILPQKTPLDEHSYFFSAERTLELIAIVESEPFLWDKTQLDYKNVKMTENAWRMVASKMELDVEVCKEKWTCLRAQFRKLKRRMIQSSQNGTGSDQIYRPSWYAYEAMTFLNRAMDYGKASNMTYGNIPEGTEATFVENNYFLSNENTLEFIAVVESHPLLWNKAHPDYGNVKRLEDTWQLVADEMDLDVEDCKDKWNSLRAQFRRLRRKILQSSEDATGSDQIYQPSWYAYDAMTFLTDVIQHGKAKKRRLSSPRPKPEPQSNSNAPRTSTVRKSDDGFFLDSLEILNADDDEDQEQLSSIDGSPYPSDDEEEEYLEEQEQLLAEEKTCDEGEDPSPTEEDIEVSSRHPCD